MKKDIYVIIGIVALTAAFFIGGAFLYRSNDSSALQKSGESGAVPRADSSLLVREWSPSLGPSMARIELVEFLDPECESCRAMHPLIKKILKDYEGQIRYVVRYMPFHGNSELAARWLEAAGEQGKYWEALDALFEGQPEWGSHHNPRPDLIPEMLKNAGVDIVRADADKENSTYSEQIRQDKEDGIKLGVRATPTIFVNGRALSTLGDAPLRRLIDDDLK